MAMVSGGGSFRPPFPATGFSQVVAAEQARPGQAGRLYSILCVRVCVCVCVTFCPTLRAWLGVTLAHSIRPSDSSIAWARMCQFHVKRHFVPR